VGDNPTSFSGHHIELSDPAFRAELPGGREGGAQRFALVVIDAARHVALHDSNDLQVELSFAASRCAEKHGDVQHLVLACVPDEAFGGLPSDFVNKAFGQLWSSYEYWRLCNFVQPAKTLSAREMKLGWKVEVLRQSPLVATVRGFVKQEECQTIMREHAGLDKLVQARVGDGGGGTRTDEYRETLTNNVFVNWDDQSSVLAQKAAATFDLVSELLGVQMPYEAQEPINFLHYTKGYEYRPHTDGAAERQGKRVATTLVYCEAAAQGGGTVFPQPSGDSPPLRYQPGPGDVLFFAYAPDPAAQLHSACPVISGNKSTLTQWHRLGVSPDTPWDNFEDWGSFPNPMIHTRWKGPRYGAAEPKAESTGLWGMFHALTGSLKTDL